jgi:hypothetical protein
MKRKPKQQPIKSRSTQLGLNERLPLWADKWNELYMVWDAVKTDSDITAIENDIEWQNV